MDLKHQMNELWTNNQLLQGLCVALFKIISTCQQLEMYQFYTPTQVVLFSRKYNGSIQFTLWCGKSIGLFLDGTEVFLLV